MDIEYPFITITPRSTLTMSGSTYSDPVYESIRTIRSFTKDYYY